MSLGLYTDVHVPAAITRGPRRRGVEVLTAQEDGTTRLGDPELLDRAGALGRILFTRDEDLLAVAAERLGGGKPFASVVFARQLEVSIGRCVADLEVIAKAAASEESRSQVSYLPL